MATDRQRGNDIGDIGKRVGDQVRRLRQHLEVTQQELSSQLADVGRPIPTASIGRLESGDRRVDVDDLMALAHVLDVSPLALLLPFPDSPSDEVHSGASRGGSALDLWVWAVGAAPMYFESQGVEGQDVENQEFRERSHPWWLMVEAGLDKRATSINELLGGTMQAEPLYRAQVGDSDGERQAAD